MWKSLIFVSIIKTSLIFSTQVNLFGKPGPYGLCPQHLIPENKTFVLSEQRCGSTFLDYAIAVLTNRLHYHITHHNPRDRSAHPNRFGVRINPQKDPFFASHAYKAFLQASPCEQTDKLVVIVRSYRECLMRKYHDDYGKLMRNLNDCAITLTYFGALQAYDDWSPRNRHLIYYEDMLQHPQKVFSDLLEFLDEPDVELASFLKNLDFHREKCLNFYKNSKSKGTNFTFHQQLLEPSQVQKIDDIIERRYPKLFKKYLSHYKL